jgi:hypothetical protein
VAVEGERGGELDDSLIDGEGWEDELEMMVDGGRSNQIKNWADLREQIRKDQQQQSLPLAQVNQLIILASFTTLHLRGLSQTKVSLEVA